MESIFLNSPTSKVFYQMKTKELLKYYRPGILFSIVFLIFAFLQNYFLGEFKPFLKVASIGFAIITLASFMTKINKIGYLSKKLSNEGILTLIKILSNYSEHVEGIKEKLKTHNEIIIHDVLIVYSVIDTQISEILKIGSFTTDKNNSSEMSLEGIERLRETKYKLSLLLRDLGISTKDQEGFEWKQSSQK
ncbi:hypothetical protein [Acinetobacter seifertii]|uniref:hypothetical protein n=1 Tax=Acinetobacter seifertii TaxID=1530123 RepID=UPI000C22413E|nr:hypothetical protein [Acinetobacter seifertii]PJG65678.1 hypothetical protein CVD09_15020 [Acinetobacter seifertii]